VLPAGLADVLFCVVADAAGAFCLLPTPLFFPSTVLLPLTVSPEHTGTGRAGGSCTARRFTGCLSKT